MSLVRGIDRILGRQVSVLPPRCTVYSFQRKRRKRRGKRERRWRLTVATFLQPSVLILSRLTLRHSSTWPVCSWAAASSAHRLAICAGHTQGRGQPGSRRAPGPLHHQTHGPPTAVPRRLSSGLLVAFTPLPHTACRALSSSTRTGREPKNPSTHASSCCQPPGLSQTSQDWSQRLLPDSSRRRSDSQVKS